MTLFESFGPDEWAVIAIGCILVILLPSLIIAGIATAAEATIRFVKRRLSRHRAATPETADVAPVPAATDGYDFASEWGDIIGHMEKSK
jgi:hypothetical protein